MDTLLVPIFRSHGTQSLLLIAELTSMVNNKNKYLDLLPKIPPPPTTDNCRDEERCLTSHGPLWDLTELVAIALADSDENTTVYMVTDDADTDHEALYQQGFCLLTAMQALPTAGEFKGSFWCKTSPAIINGVPRGKGRWIPCDSYVMPYILTNPNNNYTWTEKIYLKMCKGTSGNTVLFVSVHPSNKAGS